MLRSTLGRIPLWKLLVRPLRDTFLLALTPFADVASQSTSPGWNLGRWADYVDTEPSKRDKILNVISLEISGTELADMVLPPKVVRDLDWVENFWPSTRKGKNNAYPKVQLYCLMGVANAWTVRQNRQVCLFTFSLRFPRTGISTLRGHQCTIIFFTVQRYR